MNGKDREAATAIRRAARRALGDIRQTGRGLSSREYADFLAEVSDQIAREWPGRPEQRDGESEG